MAAALAVAAALGLPSLLWPLGIDQGIFAVFARAMLHGEAPYRAVIDIKTIGIYALYIVPLLLPLPYAHALRLVDWVYQLATLAALGALAWRLWDRRVAALAVLLAALAYWPRFGWWNTAQAESFAILPITLALLLALKATDDSPARWSLPGKGWRSLAAGLLLGFAVQVKLPAAAFLFALPLVEWLGGWRAGWGRRLLLAAAGFVIVQAAGLLYLVAVGSLGDFIAVMRAATGYTRLADGHFGLHPPLDYRLYLARVWPLWFLNTVAVLYVLPATFAVADALAPDRPRATLLVCALVILGSLAVFAQDKFIDYHWQLVTPFLALLAGRGLMRLHDLLWALVPRILPRLAVELVIVLALLYGSPAITQGVHGMFDDARVYFQHPAEGHRAFYLRFGDPGAGGFSVVGTTELARYIRAHTRPTDRVVIFNMGGAAVLVESHRESATSILPSLLAFADWTPPGWRQAFVRQVEERKPALIAIGGGDAGPWVTGNTLDSRAAFERWPEFRDLVRQQYRLAAHVQNYDVYLRVRPSSARERGSNRYRRWAGSSHSWIRQASPVSLTTSTTARGNSDSASTPTHSGPERGWV